MLSQKVKETDMQEVLVAPRECLVYKSHWLAPQGHLCAFPYPGLHPAAAKRDITPTPRAKVQKTSVTETANLKPAVESVIRTTGTKFCINDICQRFSLKRRVFFDFLWIVNSIGICTRVSNEEYISNGIEVSESFLKMARDCAASDQRPLSVAFDCRSDSSLTHVTRQFVMLFHYLDVDILDLRKVARLFVHGNEKLKTMMRKLYSISVALEAVNVVTRTMKPAEVKLIRPRNGDVLSVMDITALLNTTRAIPAVVLRRRAEFDNLARSYGCQ